MCDIAMRYFHLLSVPRAAMNTACVVDTRLEPLSGDDVNRCNVSNRSVPYDAA